MEIVVIHIVIALLFALLGRNRQIGYGWSFLLCLFLSPVIGLIIILFSKKTDQIDFVDINVENKKNKDV